MEEIIGEEQLNYRKMVSSPVPGLIGRLAVPTIVSMLVTAAYNTADTYFVSRLGTSATGAVGIVFAMMTMIQAIGFTVGMGSGSLLSRALGRRDRQEANRIASSGFALSLALGLAVMTLGLLFNRPLMNLLGATPTILPYAEDYARWIFFGAPLMCCSFLMNNLLRAEGRATLSMIGLGVGGILNIALDPLFIFGFNLGIAGAAQATVLSQCVSFSILLAMFLSRRSISRLQPASVSRSAEIYLDILRNGAPTFSRQSLASAATTSLNHMASLYGDAAVAAMSIVNRLFMLILASLLGFGQGFQPVAGYNYGAGRFDRVRTAYFFCVRTGTIWLTAIGALAFAFAPEVVAAFRDDPEVVAIGAAALRAQCIALPLQATIMITNMVLQSTGKSLPATILSMCRQGIFFLPLIFILPAKFGLFGVEITQSVADALSFLCCFPFIIPFLRELKRKRQERAKPAA